MIQSVSKDLNYNLSTSSVSASTVSKKSSSDTDLKAESQVPKTDTVEISTQAREAMQQSKVAASNTERPVQTDSSAESTAQPKQVAQSPAAGTPPKAVVQQAAVAASDESESTSSTSQSTVLSSLTENQMDKLVSNGTITKNQEQQELAKRAAEKEQQTASDNAKVQISKVQQQGIDAYKQQAQFGIGAVTESQSLLNIVA